MRKIGMIVLVGAALIGAGILGKMAWQESVLSDRVQKLRPLYSKLLWPVSPGTVQMAIQRAITRPELRTSQRTKIDSAFIQRVRDAYNPVSFEREYLRVIAEKCSDEQLECLVSGRCFQSSENKTDDLAALRQEAFRNSVQTGQRVTQIAEQMTGSTLASLARWLQIPEPVLPRATDVDRQTQEAAQSKLEKVFLEMSEDQVRASLGGRIVVSDSALNELLTDAHFEALNRLHQRFSFIMNR